MQVGWAAHSLMGSPNAQFTFFRAARPSPKARVVRTARPITPVGKFIFTCRPNGPPVGHVVARFWLGQHILAVCCPKMFRKLAETPLFGFIYVRNEYIEPILTI